MITISYVMMVIGAISTVAGGILYSIYSGKENAANHKELLDKGNQSKKEIIENQKYVIANVERGIKKVDKKISSMPSQGPKISIQNPNNSTIQINENGDNIINQPKEQYKPEISFLERQSVKDPLSNHIRTKFIFGSKDGFPLKSPDVEVTFTTNFISASGGVTGNGIVSAGQLLQKAANENRKYKISTDFLNAGNYFFIETVSNTELEILDLRVRP
ncbi:hypothetical protein ACM55H_12200 [Flavobacterium sp. ZT3R17]|uniref:hypothetical protein n=1 Tax=Flavobacterium cryoconiti TaxID=3398736 RepID=UPI003A8C6E12